MRDGGYIKVWRKMLDSQVMQDDWLCRLWVWCMLKAQWQNGELRRGQFATGRVRGSDELKVSPSKWYRGIERLAELGCITVETNSNRTTITVCNYETYQDWAEESEQRADSKRTASEQLTLIEEELEEGKNAGDSTVCSPPAQSASDDIHSPEWLARKWVFSRRGTQGRGELNRARGHFEEMIRLGCPAAQIAAEIDSKIRRRTEPVWDFEKRVMQAQGLWKDDRSGSKAKTSLSDAVMDGAEWVQERNANDTR